MSFFLWIDLTSIILDYMNVSYNQDFEAANPNVKQIKKTNKYIILFIANLKIDNFYKKRQTVMPE